jgi:hypothetical protein
MSITSLIKRTVLAEFRVDTNQANRELDGLIAKNQHLKESATEAAKGQAAHLDGFTQSMKGAGGGIQEFIGKLSPWKQAFEMAGKAVDYAQDALKSYGETLRLESKTAGINIEKLEQSFDGLINHHDLLQFAASTSTGVLKLNQQQMQTVAEAALALRDRGHDLSESFEKLKDAAIKGKVEGLDDLGISVKQGSSNAETLKNMMTELNKVIAESGPHTKNAADDVDRLAAGWDNAKESMKKYSAQFIMEVADSALSLDKMDEMAGRVWLHESQAFGAFQSGIDSGRGQVRYQQGMHNFAVGFNRGKQQVLDSQVIQMDDLNVSRTDAERKQMAEEAVTREARAILRAAVASSDRNVASATGFGTGGSLGAAANTNTYDGYGVANDLVGDALRRTDERDTAALAEQGSRESRYAASSSSRTQSYLETMFGPIEDFKAYEAAFGSLQTATSSAMSAWISGSVSLGTAIKKGIGDALGALASQLMVESLKHGAYAIGSLAFGDVAGAARHAAAAAVFGTGAVTAATVARSLGGHASAAPGASGSGGSSSGTSSGAGTADSGPDVRDHRTNAPTGGPMYFIVGEHFSQESPRQKAIDAEDTIRRALGGSGSRDG